MTTTPPTVSSEITAIEKKIGVWLDPIHIILVIVCILTLLGGIYLWESKRAEVAEAKAAMAADALKAAKEAAVTSAVQNAAQQAKSEALEAQMAAVNVQLQTANAQLVTANRQLSAALVTQQKVDAQMTPQGQAVRWTQLVPNAIVAATSRGFTVDPVGGLTTIQDLEELPIDRQTIKNLSTEVSNDEKAITNLGVSLSAEQAAHQSDVANDKKQLVVAQDETKKVQADFNVYKHKARRNYIKWFVAGFITGMIGAHAAGI